MQGVKLNRDSVGMNPFRHLLFSSFVLAATAIGSAAQSTDSQPAAPVEIQARMPKKAVSLLFGTYPIGPAGSEILVHVFAVPTSKPNKLGGGVEAIKPPYSRKMFVYGVSIPDCRFVTELLQRQGAKTTLLNHVTFDSVDPVNRIEIRYLDPKTRLQPIIALHTGVTHWLGWQLLVFPHGVNKEVITQYFSFGGEGDSGSTVELDQEDQHGTMLVKEEWSDGDKQGTHMYAWDGVEFADHSRPYFVIAASLNSRAEAESYVQRHQGIVEDMEVRPSAHYPALKPGYYIVITRRFAVKKDAEEYLRDLRKNGTSAYVSRAF